jgi:hypothetical protein
MNNNNTTHCLSSVYLIITPLYIVGVSAAHLQDVECIYELPEVSLPHTKRSEREADDSLTTNVKFFKCGLVPPLRHASSQSSA